MSVLISELGSVDYENPVNYWTPLPYKYRKNMYSISSKQTKLIRQVKTGNYFFWKVIVANNWKVFKTERHGEKRGNHRD